MIEAKITKRNMAYLVEVWSTNSSESQSDAAAALDSAFKAARNIVASWLNDHTEVDVEQELNWRRISGGTGTHYIGSCGWDSED